MGEKPNWVVVGRFGRAHGIKGCVSVVSFTKPYDNILQYDHWHVANKENEWKPLSIEHTELSNKLILVKVAGYETREEVSILTNREIAISSQQLRDLEAGEYYWHDLLGMSVVTSCSVTIGVVTDIMETGSNDVLVVSGERRRLIPFLPDSVILSVDTQKRVITVDWDMEF